jgi:cytochrome oxidase Cu insertion factor (SCO1/SenC/PrrC family)
MPEVTVFDADGKPFETASLKGKYSVVVFGCLT